MSQLIEQIEPMVQQAGFNSKKNFTLSGSANFDMSGSTGTFKTPSGGLTLTNGANTSAGKTFQENGVIIPKYEELSAYGITATSTSFTLFVNDNVSGTYQVAAASAVFGTASTSGTLQVEVATGTQAVGAGVSQLTGTVSLSGTANTTVNGTVIASPTTLSAGARVNLILAGTLTNLANCAVTVTLQRLS